MMSYKVKVSDNLSRDKIVKNGHNTFIDIVSQGKSVDLRNNSKSIDLQNGYKKIIPIDKKKFLKSN